MLFEIINPSDAYTVEAHDPELAALAVLLLGRGAFGVEDEAGETVLPLLLFGGDPDETLRNLFGRGLDEGMGARKAELPAVLRSVMIGSRQDREVAEAALEAIPSEEAKRAFLEKRHDKMRSSLNDIGGGAWALADRLEAAAR